MWRKPTVSTASGSSPSPPATSPKSGIPTRRGTDLVHRRFPDPAHDGSVDRVDPPLPEDVPQKDDDAPQKDGEPAKQPLTTNADGTVPERQYPHSPATPWGVINFATDTAEILSCAHADAADSRYSGLLVVILILPPVLYFAFVHSFLATVTSYAAAFSNLLFGYPTDPAIRRAYTVRNLARTYVAVRLWLHILIPYGFAVLPVADLESWGGVSLAGAVVIALLPINALAAAVDALMGVFVRPPLRAFSRIARHLRSNAPHYTLAACLMGSGAGAYHLVGFVNEIVAEETRRMDEPLRMHRHILAELEALRADVEALKRTYAHL